MDRTSTSTSWERAQQLFNKNIELEKKRQKSVKARIPSDPNIWHQICENYESIILEDHTFSEKHNIELFLWQLHYKRIEEFRAHFSAAQASARSSATNSSKAPLKPDRVAKIRVQFKAFLSEATGFYHDLIVKIRAKDGLPLGHFSDNLDIMSFVGNDATRSSDVKKALVSCHRCLIYLGDLVRYKGLYGEEESRSREYSAASSYYLQAASLWPSNGNPHHQLAILANYASDEVVAVYRYFRSLAAEVPFPTAKDNLVIAFEKNRQSYVRQLETTKNTVKGEVDIKNKYKDFCNRFVRLQGILYSRTSLETFPDVLSSVTGALHELLSSGPEEKHNFGRDDMENGLVILRLAAILIFSVYNVTKKTEGQTYAEILQHNVVHENTCTVTFELMDLIVERCLQLHDPSSSSLLPAILIFLEWLVCCPDVATCAINEKKITAAKMSFWKHCIALLNNLLSNHPDLADDGGDETCFTNMTRYEVGENESRFALGEDFELRGFLPLLPAQSILEFSRKHSPGGGGINKERQTRVKRIIAAGKTLTSVAMVDQMIVSFDSSMKQFIIGTQPQVPQNSWPNTYLTPSESPSTEQEVAKPSVNSMTTRDNTELIFEGDNDDEEIVFKPVIVEKLMDAVGLTQNSFDDPEKATTSVGFHQVLSQLNMPISDTKPLQTDPLRDLHNPTWFTEHQASVVDGIKKMRFVDNGLMPMSDMKGSLGVQNSGSLFPPQLGVQNSGSLFPPQLGVQNSGLLFPTQLGVQNSGSLFPPQPSTGLVNTAMYSDFKSAPEVLMPSNMNYTAFPEAGAENFVVKPQKIATTFKSQGGRPVRHLGPPPGFSHVPPKSVNNLNMPVSGVAGTNGSMIVDDYRWLDGFQMLSSTSNLGPSYAMNQVPIGTNPVGNYSDSCNGHSGFSFSGMQSSGLPYSEYQSFRNMHHNPGQKLPEQQIMPGNQFNSQTEHYQGQPTWPGQHRV